MRINGKIKAILTLFRTNLNLTSNFTTFLDERGLSAKALRVQNLQNFVEDINQIVRPILKSLDAELITDPATVVSPNHFGNLREIVEANIDWWGKIDFPTREQLFVRTTGWDSTFYFPYLEIHLGNGIDSAMESLYKFLEEKNPQQIIMHPRYSNEVAMTRQFSIRARAIPGDIHVFMGQGGTVHIAKTEDAKERYEFACKNYPENLPEKFKCFANALEIIVPAADAVIPRYSKLVTDNNLPVYEIKGIEHNGKFLLNMFDYEIA